MATGSQLEKMENPEFNVEPTAEECAEVVQRLRGIQQQVTEVSQRLGLKQEPRLVAVSKTKPAALVRACFEAGHVHFGENYVQELVTKSKQLPEGIKWRFIGHLQSNKCKQVLSVSNLDCVETVDSVKLATALDKAAAAVGRTTPLSILVQINTSGEESKSGADPEKVVEVVKEIREKCSRLHFAGLMTIGRFDEHPEPDFRKLVECRKKVCDGLGLPVEQVELSMGMSHDFKIAIEEGSTNVRVGSSIFGARVYHK